MVVVLISLLGAAPVLELTPAFEVRAEPPRGAEQRALHDAYRAPLEVLGTSFDDAVVSVQAVRQPFLGRRRLFVAGGWARGGHRPLPTRWLVRDKQETLVLSAATRSLDEDGFRRALTDVRLCPAAAVLEDARTVRDGGVPEPGRTCTSVLVELSRAAVLGGNAEARAEGLALLLAALVDGSEPGVVVRSAETLSKGFLDALAGRVSPGFQRFAPRAGSVTPFSVTLRDGRAAAQGLLRSGPGTRTLETVSMVVLANGLEFTSEHLAREILRVE